MFVIPEVVVFGIALALLLFALAGLSFVELERKLFAGAPFPLNWILSHLLSAQAAVLGRIRSWAIVGIGAATTVLLAIFDVNRQLFDHLVTTLEKVWTLGATLRAVSLALYHQALHYTQLVADGIAANVITTVHYLEALVASARADATAGIDRVSSDLARGLRAVDGALGADVAHVEQVISADAADLAHALTAGLAGAERSAASALSGAVAGIDAELHAQVGALQGSIDGVWKDTIGRIDAAQATTALGITSAVAGVLALIRAGVLATVTTINAELDKCVRPNCAWMHALSSTFTSLTSVAEVGLLVAFLLEAIADPAAAATQVVDVVDPIANEVYAGMADVLGALYGKAAA